LTNKLLTQKTVFYLNILLGVVLFLVTVFVIRDILSHHFEQKTRMRTVEKSGRDVASAKPDKQLAEYAVILANNPFGFSGGEIKPLTGTVSTKTQRGDILLVGTVVGPKELSYAILRDSAGVQEIFKIGEPVYDIGNLYKIERDKIIMRKGEKSEEILLEEVRAREVKQTSAVSSTRPSFAQKIGRATYVVDQARLQQAIANPGQMMTDARLKPNIINGKEEGFVLSEVKAGGIYQSLGLQDGDVLLRINDYDISNPEKALQAFTALKGMERVQVDLMRGGSRLTMTYQVK